MRLIAPDAMLLENCMAPLNAASSTGAPAAEPLETLRRENAYLRGRIAQLQEDVTAITAEAERLRQVAERLHGRTPLHTPNPSGGGL